LSARFLGSGEFIMPAIRAELGIIGFGIAADIALLHV
jgi:hypothetical protein